MRNKRIATKVKRVSQLLKCVEEGRFAIPKLQREFVWDGPKAAKLFESILAHMPVGVVMIDCFKRKMVRHLIPVTEESGVWSTNVKAGFKRMTRKRNEMICRELKAEAGMRLFQKDI